MLRQLRSGGIIQWVMVAVVGAIIAVFVLEFRAAGGAQTGTISRRCVVKVGRECVGIKDFFTSYNLIVPPGMPAKSVKALELRKHIAEGLLERELLILEADRLGVAASVDSLDNQLALGLARVSLPATQALRLGYTLNVIGGDADGLSRDMVRELPVKNSKTREFDPEIYKRTVRNVARRSPKEFKELQMRELVAARMRDLVRSRVRVSEEEAYQAFARDRSQAIVRTVELDREWFARYAVDTSDAAVDAWAVKHTSEVDAEWKKGAEGWAQGCPLASEILFTVAPGMDDGNKASVRERAIAAKARVESGESFAQIARELSEGASAVVGGDLGCLEAGRYGPGGDALVKAVQALEPGKLSDVIETERGFHVMLARGKLGEAVETTGRRAIARSLMVGERGTALADDFGKKLIDRVKAGAPLDEATASLVTEFARVEAPAADAKAKKQAEGETMPDPAHMTDRRRPRVEISSPFSMSGNPIPSALPTASPTRAAFALEKDGDVHPELVPTLEGFAVMQLKEKTAATREDFEKDKAQIVRQLRVAKQSDAFTAYIERLREQYKDKIVKDVSLVEDGTQDEEAEG